ncbi:MAG TPA: pentapeptide repeat-containing protein [Burkholderiaceae bacterium]|nr:pentapeptide repeat-containing protein [Burkholderiaceae bacterium]
MERARAAGVDLTGSRVLHTNLRHADLRGATLHVASLINVDLEGADMSGSRVFGVGAWHLQAGAAHQHDLVITPPDSPTVSCDDLETAQFVYLLLHNQKLRQVIDTVGRKAVLLLGRFTSERKAVLDALRNALRQHGFVPMLFDFEKPPDRDLTETVSTLAHLARFIVADLTDPRSIPQELKAIVPSLPSVPVQPLLHASQNAYDLFADFGGFASVLPPARYRDLSHLLLILDSEVIAPAEQRIEEIRAKRAAFEAKLTGS